LDAHFEALSARHQADVEAVAAAADGARAAIEGHAGDVGGYAPPVDVTPTIGGMPVDDLPPYVPPPNAHAENALIPDTPLVDGGVGGSLAFDDSPLWQN
jgi:hypothetical protein